jgi:hypothetical protein
MCKKSQSVAKSHSISQICHLQKLWSNARDRHRKTSGANEYTHSFFKSEILATLIGTSPVGYAFSAGKFAQNLG